MKVSELPPDQRRKYIPTFLCPICEKGDQISISQNEMESSNEHTQTFVIEQDPRPESQTREYWFRGSCSRCKSQLDITMKVHTPYEMIEKYLP
jgi:hypothetical protein